MQKSKQNEVYVNYIADKIIIYFLRFSIGLSFLSAVADRFGIWGLPGGENVVWGNFESFTQYTAILNSFIPQFLITPLAWIATVLEVILGLFLIIGFKVKVSAFLSGLLLASFGLTMAISVGIKAPFDYSVFTASAACFGLYLLVQRKN